MATQTPARQLYDLLVSRNFDPELLDSAGRTATDPSETEVFSFDYTTESGNDYGTIVIMLGDDNDLEVYFGDNVGKGMEGEDKQEWFDFLYQLRMFSKRNLMSFGLKNLNRLRYSMQGQAAIKEGLFESWTGTRTQSWNGKQTEARLMIKHKRPLGETDARFRYVQSLFVETAEGERYKLPFTKLSGGRAMVEHVRHGGKPYDVRGQHIATIVNELNVLSRFRKANHGKIFEGDTAQLVEQTNAYYETAQRTLKSLSTGRGYATYFESWDPSAVSEQEVVIEGLKHLFVTQSLDQRIEEALPILARIQQQGTDMKEANIFETWVNRLAEGTWATPDTPEKQEQLITLMSKELPVGADATNATEQLYDLIGDDELFDQLDELAERDANADCRQVIFDRMQELSDDPDILEVINNLNVDADYEMNPPAGTQPADLEPDEPTMEEVKDPYTQTEDPAGTKQPAYPEYSASLKKMLDIAGVPAKERPAPDYEEELLESLLEGAMKDIDIARQDCKSMTDKEFIKAYGQSKDQWREKHKDLVKEDVLNDSTGSTLQHIKDTFKRDVKDFTTTGEMSRSLHDALYDYYFDDMPYGVQKARDGDPYEWVADRFGSELGLEGYGMNSPGIGPEDDPHLERESVVHGDYAEENSAMRQLAGLKDKVTDEGIGGALAGGVAGAVLGGPVGAVRGAIAGDKIGDLLSPDDKKTDEGYADITTGSTPLGETTVLAGQYGHSGKMQAVGNLEQDIVSRLQELSGLIRFK